MVQSRICQDRDREAIQNKLHMQKKIHTGIVTPDKCRTRSNNISKDSIKGYSPLIGNQPKR